MSEQDTGLQQNGRRRRWVWLAVGVLVVVAAIGWWWLRAPSRGNTNPADGGEKKAAHVTAQSRDSKLVAAHQATVINGVPSLRAASSTGRRDNERKPFRLNRTAAVTDVVEEQLPMAQAGDTEVMLELGIRLSTCRDYVDGDEVSVRRNALRDFFEQNGHDPKTDDEVSLVAVAVEGDIRMLASCRGLDTTLVATGVNWVERAARAGDIDALLWYESSALYDMRSREDVLMNLDEVARRREVARGFMRTALDRGACNVLIMYSLGYGGTAPDFNWLFKADPYLSLVYAEAAVHAGVAGDFYPQTLTGISDPARRSAAAAQGAALAARHCDTPR